MKMSRREAVKSSDNMASPRDKAQTGELKLYAYSSLKFSSWTRVMAEVPLASAQDLLTPPVRLHKSFSRCAFFFFFFPISKGSQEKNLGIRGLTFSQLM